MERKARGAFCEDLEAAGGVGGVEADGADFFTARDDIGRENGRKQGTCENNGRENWKKLPLAGRPGARKVRGLYSGRVPAAAELGN
jgi:hypothetical protein